ncbi:MAG: PPC domain-containing protein, partial [Gemmataceae bacterium]|nr:PPC domain-containing protein [Gemmataceae bacterium]
MASQCPACSKTNPADAVFCYYDGRPLSQGRHDGPVQIGSLPFPMPFCFSDGQSCANFNQLALACDERWDEARTLLAQEIWPSFFAAIGRLDLMAAAKQAAKEPDRDVGLSQLLERFPADADALRPPKLALPAPAEDLGTLEPGQDHKFEVRISNQGMLVLRGMVMTDCDWLSFGDDRGSDRGGSDRAGAELRMFQTRNIYTLPVRVLGHKLRAGRKPLEGQIVIDTNGGSITLPVRAKVPIRPFPQHANNVLAGAKSPHELAVKAKAHPHEAAALFEQGAVRAWYASNGWTYPIQGTDGTGKGAVQQFFEALGLTKAPKLEINTAQVACKGEAGRRLTKQVTISTKESRHVYAQAWSNQNWIKAGAGKSQGNTLTIPLHIDVPPRPGETFQASVTFEGNGKQRFVVPVALTVVAAVPAVHDEAEESSGPLPWGWIFAGTFAVLLVAAGVFGFIISRQAKEGEGGGPPVAGNNDKPGIAPPPAAAPTGAWWDSIPDAQLGATVAALKESAPHEQALFDGIALASDVERYKAYEQLAAKLPELAGNAKVKDPLGRFLVDCCVFEPSELNVAPVRRALTSQIPKDGAAFRPEDKGAELDRGVWSLQVGFDALTHKAMRPERGRSMAHDLETVFGFGLDAGAPPDELKAQTEKLLAVRCYRNTLPTAAKSIDHALAMRALLIERFPKHLSPAFREKIDVDLFAVGLATGGDVWPQLEPILTTCLESNDLTIGLKIAGIYDKAKPELARKMEGLLAAKWKAAAGPNLTQAERASAIQKSLIGAAARAKISPAERLKQLQQLATGSLAALKTPTKKDMAFLQDTVRLAHASTMACALFHKELGLERFDELVSKAPELEPAETAKSGDTKPEEKQPAANAGMAVGAQPKAIRGQLTASSARDANRGGALCTVHVFSLKAGQLYTIDLLSTAFDAFLRLEDAKGQALAADDDGGAGLNSRIVFVAQADGA